jgi:hypothetical protein
MDPILRRLALVAALAAAACSPRAEPAPQVQPADLAGIALAVEADSALQRREQPLFEAGLAHALPRSSVYDPERARQRFDTLRARFPASRYLGVVAYLLPLLEEAQRQDARAAAAEQEGERLRQALAAARLRMDTLQQERNGEAARADRLDAQLRARDARVRALEQQLEALRRIDLGPGE